MANLTRYSMYAKGVSEFNSEMKPNPQFGEWVKFEDIKEFLKTLTNTGMAAEAQICQDIMSYLKEHGYHSHKGMCAGTLELAIKNRVVGKLRHA